jgi:hypothetical protein
MTARLTTDWKLFVPILLLLAFGLVMVYSASSVVAEVVYERPIWEFAFKQLRFAGLGLVILFALKSIDYRRFNQPHWVLVPLGLVVLMLIGVIFADPVAHRWYKLPRFNLQPSEFAKPAIVLFVAWFVAQREARKKGVNDRHTIGPAALVVGLTAVLIAVGDLGTAVILLVPAVVIFYVAGIERRYFFMTAALCLLLFAGFLIQKPYRIFRIMAPLGITVEMVAENPRLQWLAPIIAESKAARDPDYQPRQSRSPWPAGASRTRARAKQPESSAFSLRPSRISSSVSPRRRQASRAACSCWADTSPSSGAAWVCSGEPATASAAISCLASCLSSQPRLSSISASSSVSAPPRAFRCRSSAMAAVPCSPP